MNPAKPLAKEQIDRELGLVVKRLLEDLVLVGDKVYTKKPPRDAQRYILDGTAHLKADLLLEQPKVKVGEETHLRVHLTNEGGIPVFLTKIEDFLPTDFELVTKPAYGHLSAGLLDLNKHLVSPSETEELHLAFTPLSEGTFSAMPKISYINGKEEQTLCNPCCVTIEVSENRLPNRVRTGYRDLDNLLLGGIPEKYAVIMTSISCDERELLIKRFLKTALKENGVTFCFTIDPARIRTLSESFPDNFFAFICNPQADTVITDQPNIYKLKGVDNLTDLSISLNSAFRKLDSISAGRRSAFIGIISDVLLQHGATQTRRWLTGLVTELRSRGFTTLAVMNPHMHRPEEVQAILDLFEGEITIFEKGTEKLLQVKKLYNQVYLENQRPVRKMKLAGESLTRRGKWQRY